jgi:hypothetical protein
MNLRHLQVCANVSIHGVASPRNGGKSEENRRPKNPMKLVEDFQHAEKARPKTVLW